MLRYKLVTNWSHLPCIHQIAKIRKNVKDWN